MNWTTKNSPFQFVFSRLLVGLILATFTAVTPSSAPAENSIILAQKADADPTFSGILAFVERQGWTVDLGRLCVALKLNASQSECLFKQIAVSDGENKNHGFNLPLNVAQPVPYVILYQLRPLVGTFFIATPEGKLKASYYRSQGIEYTALPDDDAQPAFLAEISFWKSNLATLEEMAKVGGIKR